MEKDYTLTIAVAVALVAIVGLVMPFGGSSSGALYYAPYSTGSDDGSKGYDLGAWVAQGWLPDYGDQSTYCSYECGNVCKQAHAEGKVRQLGGDCKLNCESNCGRLLLKARGFSR